MNRLLPMPAITLIFITILIFLQIVAPDPLMMSYFVLLTIIELLKTSIFLFILFLHFYILLQYLYPLLQLDIKVLGFMDLVSLMIYDLFLMNVSFNQLLLLMFEFIHRSFIFDSFILLIDICFYDYM